MRRALIPVCLVCLILTGCKGKDGADGAIYFALHHDGNVVYSDNNPDLPSPDSTDIYYLCSPGTYDFTYRFYVDDDFFYFFDSSYTLTANKGEKGDVFWQTGMEGAAKQYVLGCYVDGPILRLR
jgi:hypothetical protein